MLGWVPRIERKIAQAFMGGRRWERGTTAAPRLCCAAVSVRAATVAGKGETPPPLGFMLLVRLHSAASSSAPARPHDSQARRRNRPSVHRLFASSQISPRFAPQNWPPHVGGITKPESKFLPTRKSPRPQKCKRRRRGIRLAFPFLN